MTFIQWKWLRTLLLGKPHRGHWNWTTRDPMPVIESLFAALLCWDIISGFGSSLLFLEWLYTGTLTEWVVTIIFPSTWHYPPTTSIYHILLLCSIINIVGHHLDRECTRVLDWVELLHLDSSNWGSEPNSRFLAKRFSSLQEIYIKHLWTDLRVLTAWLSMACLSIFLSVSLYWLLSCGLSDNTSNDWQ